MKRAIPLGVFCLIQPMVFVGCTPLGMAKRGLTEIAGASGEHVSIKDMGANGFAKFKDVKLVEVRNDIGKVCPAELITQMKADFVKTKTKLKDLYPGGEPALHVDLTVTYLQDAGGAGALLGGLGFMVVRGTFKDDQGALVSDALFVAESEAMRTDEAELAGAVVKAVGDYLKKFKKE